MINEIVHSKSGRINQKEITKFQTICWFNSIAKKLSCNSPTKLEKRIQPDNIKINQYGEEVISESWKRYRKGSRLPNDGFKVNGNPGPVIAAEKYSLESGYIFRHPIWKVMRSDRIELYDALEILKYFSNHIRRWYIDLEQTNQDDIYDSFVASADLEIWIDTADDMLSSLDHLSVNLMMLRMDHFKYGRKKLEGIAKNIGKTLGPISASPIFELIHEELYDWLENNIWHDLFDKYYFKGSKSDKGWRRTIGQWIAPNYR